MKKSLYLFLVFAVVAVSGCVGGGDIFQGLVGGGEPEAQTPDIIVMKSFNVVPKPPVQANNEFSIVFDVLNQNSVQSIRDANIRLFDWGACSPDVINFLPDGWIEDTTRGTITKTFDELAPNQVERIELKFTAPDNEKIGYIPATCNVKWSVDYKFSARSSDDFTVISKTRQQELQRSGETVTAVDNPQQLGIGPVSIVFDFKTPVPVSSKGSIQFSVKAVDRGKGLFASVKAGSFYVKVPKSWTSTSSQPCTDKFSLVGEEGGNNVWISAKDIPLIKRESQEVVCRFNAPDLDAEDIPERSYALSSNITDYMYSLQTEQSVRVEPTA